MTKRKDWKKCPKIKSVTRCWDDCKKCRRQTDEQLAADLGQEVIKAPLCNEGRVTIKSMRGYWATIDRTDLSRYERGE